MRRFFFEISDIIKFLSREKQVTGIQRVTLNIIRHTVNDLGENNVFLLFSDGKHKNRKALSAAQVMKTANQLATSILGRHLVHENSKHSSSPSILLQRYQPHSAKYLFHKLRIDLEAARGNSLFFEKRGYSITDWKEHRQRNLPLVPSGAIEADKLLRKDDAICVLGAPWRDPILDRDLLSYKNQGIKIHVMVHDLIPILFPGLVIENPIVYHNWLVAASGYCTQLIANSKSTANDLRHYLDKIEVSADISTLQLAQGEVLDEASTFSSDNKPNVSIPNLRTTFNLHRDVREAAKYPYALCVGTLEARKNCWSAVQAWLELIKQHNSDFPRLVFAGKRGWLNADFFRAYDASGGWGGWVTIVEQPSDQELEFLYSNCTFTVNLSVYEGWGLPIGEGLKYGKTGIVSNTSSMPEVGGEFVEYCDPHRLSSIISACNRLLQTRPVLEEKISLAKLRTWQDVSKDLIAMIN